LHLQSYPPFWGLPYRGLGPFPREFGGKTGGRRPRAYDLQVIGWVLALSLFGADEAPDDCLRWLQESEVAFRTGPTTRGVRRPVEPRGPVRGVRLVSRGRRAPLMDCELLRALAEAAPVFRELGVRELSFSGAYDYRTRRDSGQLSAHAAGLAIDVHALRGPGVDYDVARDFEAGVGRWVGLAPTEAALGDCIGSPRTPAGRALRTLVCRLKLHGAFRVIVTPDDDADHRDHLHLEAFPDLVTRVSRLLGVLPLRPR
jgi:hypothetical protein